MVQGSVARRTASAAGVAALHVFAHSAHTAVQRRATVLARTPSGGWHTLHAGITTHAAQPQGGLSTSMGNIRAEPTSLRPWQTG